VILVGFGVLAIVVVVIAMSYWSALKKIS